MSTETELAQAKKLIQAKRYEDAKALLITIDHPTADKWLAKLNRLSSPSNPLPMDTIPEQPSIKVEQSGFRPVKFLVGCLFRCIWAVVSMVSGSIVLWLFARIFPEAIDNSMFSWVLAAIGLGSGWMIYSFGVNLFKTNFR